MFSIPVLIHSTHQSVDVQQNRLGSFKFPKFNTFHYLLQSGIQNQFFRWRKKFLTTYAIVSFSCSFFSRPFMKISNFSKTFHTILIKFCTVILHPKRPLRAQTHQNRTTGMLETAKISPKVAKKELFFDIFRFSQKLPIRFERNFLQYSHFLHHNMVLCVQFQ